jgi:hypothetical protein
MPALRVPGSRPEALDEAYGTLTEDARTGVARSCSSTPARDHAAARAQDPKTFCVFCRRLRTAGLLGSMGRVASSVDNTMIESLSSTMQRELLDRRPWVTRHELALLFQRRPAASPTSSAEHVALLMPVVGHGRGA